MIEESCWGAGAWVANLHPEEKPGAAHVPNITSNIGGVSRTATETGAAAHVLSCFGELSQQTEKLRSEVDKFLANIRAA
jgi:methyl-accepting chemotaxis protein